jgi:hypothetical protein
MIIAYSREWQYKEIESRRQLFIDDDVVACVRNIKRTQHSPRKHPANPLIVRDKPWEVVPYFRTPCFNVAYDPAEKLFKCWYEDMYSYFGMSKVDILQGDRIYYAESTDGIHWHKPAFDKLLHDGQGTNCVFSYPPVEMASCNTILFDPNDPDPARRYKSQYVLRTRNINRPKISPMPGPHSNGLHLAFSPNGIDWTPYAGNPLIKKWGSDVEILTYDPIDRKYVLFGRADGKEWVEHPEADTWFLPVYPGGVQGIWGTRRCVFRMESTDLMNWSEPKLIFDACEGFDLDNAPYGLVPFRVDEMHLGILNILHEVDNTLDMELIHSRDGVNWRRFPGQRPLLPRGPAGSYDSLDIETPTQPLVVGDEIWIYYGGMSVHHDWWLFGKEEGLDIPEANDPQYAQNGHHLCLATLRLDGWVSLDATIREGYVETKPVFSTGAHLFINGRCEPGGTIQVEVMDNWNHVWSGYGKGDCHTFTGDSVHHKVAWTAGDAINMIPGIVKLRFHLRNAELYSFQIADA